MLKCNASSAYLLSDGTGIVLLFRVTPSLSSQRGVITWRTKVRGIEALAVSKLDLLALPSSLLHFTSAYSSDFLT
jgi:hypothetical protein